VDATRLCAALDRDFDTFVAAVAATRAADVGLLHGLAAAWTARIQAHADDWNAIAEIPKVQALFERVVTLDDGWARGEPHMYLGVLACLRPASLGGQP